MKRLLSFTRNKSATFILAAITFSVAVFFAWFNDLVVEQLHISIENELENMIEQQKVIIDNENANNINNLSLLAKTLSHSHFDTDAVLSYLQLQSDHIAFEQLFFIDTEGNGIATDGSIRNFENNPIFLSSIENGAPASAMGEHSTMDNGIMELAAPIYFEDEIYGVLFAVNSVNKVFEKISDIANQAGYVIIVADDGVPLVSSIADPVPLDTLDQPGSEITNGKTPADVQNDLKNRVDGILYFNSNGKNMVARYSPLEINGLSIVLVVEEDAVETGIQKISSLTSLLGLSLLILLFIITAQQVYDKRKSIKQIEDIAFYDKLTGLPNLSKLKIDMAKILKDNPDKRYAIIKVDLLNFKALNEIYGYQIGNQVLCTFEVIAASAQEPSLMIARIGVDEFIFFSEHDFLAQLDGTTGIYESQFKNYIPELENHRLSFRYGRYFIEQGESDVDDIITKVSLAHSNARGRKECVIWDYDDAYKQKVLQQASILNKMELALLNGEFRVFLQPKFDISTTELVGAEALVRWIESDGNMIYPDNFIPLFESNGFIIELDMYMLESVCILLDKWRQENKRLLTISVNFSRHHIGNENFVKNLTEIVDKYNLDHSLIEIEITESTAVENESLLRTIIEELHDAGFNISIDDFGAGFSSLGMLKDFKIDTLKLDRSFINHKDEDERGKLVIDGIVKLAHSLNMQIVAEGVENIEQVAFLHSINCEAAQGYFFDKPIPTAAFEDKYCSPDLQEII